MYNKADGGRGGGEASTSQVEWDLSHLGLFKVI